MTLTLDFRGQIFNSHILGMGRSVDLEWKRCELDTMLDVQWVCSWATVQKDQPSNGSMGNSYSFQPIGPWMGYSFTDLGAEGCCRSLNALFTQHHASTSSSVAPQQAPCGFTKYTNINESTTTQPDISVISEVHSLQHCSMLFCNKFVLSSDAAIHFVHFSCRIRLL